MMRLARAVVSGVVVSSGKCQSAQHPMTECINKMKKEESEIETNEV